MKFFISILLGFLIICNIKSQEWVSNYVNKYYDKNNLLTYDIAVTNNDLWTIDVDGYLYKFSNGSTTKFYTNFENNLDLNDFNVLKKKDKNRNHYTKIISNNNILWLIDEVNFNFVKVSENKVYTFSLKIEDLNFKYFELAEVDDKGDLFFTYNYFNSSTISSKLYKIDEKIENIFIDKVVDSYIKALEINSQELFLIKDSPMMLCVVNRDDYTRVKEIPLDSIKFKGKVKSFYDPIVNKVSFLFNKGDMMFYSNQEISYYDLHIYNLLECYWFASYDKFIFLSFSGGFFIYNTQNDKFIKQSLEYEGQKYVTFKNIISGDKQVYGLYGGVNPTNCEGLSSGIGIFSFEKLEIE